MTDAKTKDQKQPERQKTPPILVYGPPGSYKTTMIDAMMKFYGTQHVVDGYTLPAHGPGGEEGGENCRWFNLKPDTLYITNEEFTTEDVMHAGLGHGVMLVSIYEFFVYLGEARGRTAEQYFTERMMATLGAALDAALREGGGPRRGGGAPRNKLN